MKYSPPFIALSLLVAALTPCLKAHALIELGTDHSQQIKPVTMKVLIGKGLDRALLEVKGRYDIYDPSSELLITSGLRAKPHAISFEERGFRWKELFPDIRQMRIVPVDAEASILINGIEYKGCLEIYERQGKLHLINEVDVERYLKATMTAQFPHEMDNEVMDAIAIVARTNAYFVANQRAGGSWHVDAQEVGYVGHALTSQNIHVDRAIENTRHMVLTYQGTPFAAVWGKDCAGKTADFSAIFRKEVHCPPGVHSAFAARNRESRSWNYRITRTELAKALGVAKIAAFDLYQDQKSQKVYGVRVKDTQATHQFDFQKLQKALGAVHIKSNDFSIEVIGDQLLFKGFGEGLGVGLCLFSANAMADKGDKAPQILSSFFPGTQLQNMRSRF